MGMMRLIRPIELMQPIRQPCAARFAAVHHRRSGPLRHLHNPQA
jgi:hypothetical protein